MGKNRRLSCFSFLSSNPDIIILDEFTASLDKKSMLDIYNFLQQYQAKRKVLIINITHNILDLENLKGKYFYVTQNTIIQYSDKKKLLEDYTSLN